MRSDACVIPFKRGRTGRQHLVDTGRDSIFLWYSCTESWNRCPEEVEVHKHDDVDETIVLLDGEGYYLHGPTPEAMERTPWSGPCVVWMPAGDYHRIVTTSEGACEAFLMYTPARATIDPFDQTIQRAIHGGAVPFDSLPIVRRDREPGWISEGD